MQRRGGHRRPSATLCTFCRAGRLAEGVPAPAPLLLPPLLPQAHQAASANPVISQATGNGRFLIGLHSSLASAEQNVVFDRPPPGVRKVCAPRLSARPLRPLPFRAFDSNCSDNVRTTTSKPTRQIVFSTNIAETSVTIDDVVHVVDTGRVKETGFDVVSRMQQLLEGWVSKASARQRRGRAGRTQAGFCWRLFTKGTFASFPEASPPEIQRVPLEGLCLQVQLQRMSGGVAGFLSRALQAPEPEAVSGAIRNLVRIGALNEKENLTPLGHILVRPVIYLHRLASPPLHSPGGGRRLSLSAAFPQATLPVDVRVGKMLVYGTILGCLSPALTIAAALGGRSPFVAPLEKREEADLAKRSFAGEGSDHLAIVEAFNQWQEARAAGKAAEAAFCRENFLSLRALEGMADSRKDFCKLLSEAGFLGAQ